MSHQEADSNYCVGGPLSGAGAGLWRRRSSSSEFTDGTPPRRDDQRVNGTSGRLTEFAVASAHEMSMGSVGGRFRSAGPMGGLAMELLEILFGAGGIGGSAQLLGRRHATD